MHRMISGNHIRNQEKKINQMSTESQFQKKNSWDGLHPNGGYWFSKNISYDSTTINGYKGRIHQYKSLEMPGIDPGTSRMLSERSTI